MPNIDFEKITAYVVIIGTIYMFWQSQMDLKTEIGSVKERTVANEKDIEFMQEKNNHVSFSH